MDTNQTKKLSICIVEDWPEANPEYIPDVFLRFYEEGQKAKAETRNPFDDGENFKYSYASGAFRDGYYQRTLASPKAVFPERDSPPLDTHPTIVVHC